ncbi:MAG: peptidase C26 [Alphaproteobacteria bacterium CG11_big_fil_rev_8_21_14_0_20_39_49]|nr:MAG: peptidase C26 [Alphaproteobacteria bacterium CG11_big_fil_rev_8_21_14_0_20_39_49]
MKKKKPLIGVSTSINKSHLMWWFTKIAVTLAGGKPVRITAVTKHDIKKFEGFLICGGADISPDEYGHENTASIDLEPERDNFERRLIEHAVERKKPLFGICRGCQMINVVLGGTMHQNARDFYENFVPTDNVIGKILVRRDVEVKNNSFLWNIFTSEKILVNSMHHQAVDELGKGLAITAHDENKMVQAIESDDIENLFIMGVQWHPEFMIYSTKQRRLFKEFIKAAK